jgi:hypothetical protein
MPNDMRELIEDHENLRKLISDAECSVFAIASDTGYSLVDVVAELERRLVEAIGNAGPRGDRLERLGGTRGGRAYTLRRGRMVEVGPSAGKLPRAWGSAPRPRPKCQPYRTAPLTPAEIKKLVGHALDTHLAQRLREKEESGAVANNSWQIAQTLVDRMRVDVANAGGTKAPTVAQTVACVRALAADPAQRIEFRDIATRPGSVRQMFRRRMPSK